jgi:hypothetical protein
MFGVLIEEVRYCVEGGGSRSSKDKRQMAAVKERGWRKAGYDNADTRADHLANIGWKANSKEATRKRHKDTGDELSNKGSRGARKSRTKRVRGIRREWGSKGVAMSGGPKLPKGPEKRHESFDLGEGQGSRDRKQDRIASRYGKKYGAKDKAMDLFGLDGAKETKKFFNKLPEKEKDSAKAHMRYSGNAGDSLRGGSGSGNKAALDIARRRRSEGTPVSKADKKKLRKSFGSRISGPKGKLPG